MSAQRVVQAAIYAALKADAPYMALVTDVFDGDAPKATAFPYTLIGDALEMETRRHDLDGYEHTLTIHDWSDYQGTRECLLIREARDAVLNLATLTVAGWGLTRVHYEFGTILDEWDDELKILLRHQITRYRFHSLQS